MMKYLTHCLAVFLLLLAFSLSGQDVQIFMDHPDRVDAGEDFEVTVTIRKGSLTDYSRFSQDLPLGLTATNISSPNADFSFDEQRVRIIWLKLPEEDEIKVSYRISVDARLKGTFRLEGVFAYVVDDERKFLNLNQQPSITIVPNSSINQTMVVDIKDFRGEDSPAAPPTSYVEEDVFAMAVRQKPKLENSGAYLVQLLLKNPAGSKYIKVEETIPSGYIFEEVDSGDGIVSHTTSAVKFIWMTLPSASEFMVKYRLVPKQDEPQGNMTIDGLFTYTAGNQNKVVEIVEVDAALDNMSAAQKRELLASGNTARTTTPVSGAGAETRTTPPAETETRTTPPPVTETRTPVRTPDTGASSAGVIANTKVLERANGAYFRVQLTANLNPFDAPSFYRQAGVSREVKVEQHNGYYKYTVGPFQTYEQALLFVEQVNRLEEVEGAFVVGYRNGNRVSAASIR
jgi:hypothetical protein